MLEELISIIVPVYNREDVLSETVESVIRQSYKNWELLIVDDGSTDKSVQIAEEFAKGDGRIKIFMRNREPKGAPLCRNIGIERSLGEFLIFLDSDDILGPGSLETRIKLLRELPGVDFIVHPVAFFSNVIEDSTIFWNRLEGENDLERFSLQDPVWQTSGPTWRRKFLVEKNLRFDESALSGQDWEFHLRSLLLHPKYRKYPGLPDVFIRRNPEVPTISRSHRSAEKIINRVQTILNILKTTGDPMHGMAVVNLRISLLKEAIRFLNEGAVLPPEVMKELLALPTDKNSQMRKLQRFIFVGNKLVSFTTGGYAIFRRLVYQKFVAEQRYLVSSYRSPMASAEINELKIQLAKYSTYNKVH